MKARLSSVALACLCLVGPIICAATEYEKTANEHGLFSYEQAQDIDRIIDLTRTYTSARPDDRISTAQRMVSLYSDNRSNFVGLVAANALAQLGKLNLIPKSDTNEFPIILVEKSVQYSSHGLPSDAYLQNKNVREFLESLLVFNRPEVALPQSLVRNNRQAKIFEAEKKFRGQLKGLEDGPKYDLLFGWLERWEFPDEYEACMLLITEEYYSSPVECRKRLLSLFKSHIPKTAPPPYQRDHTIIYCLCTLAKSVGDVELASELRHFVHASNNAYVVDQAAEAIRWLDRRIRYPLKYQELKRQFELYRAGFYLGASPHGGVVEQEER